MDEDATFFEQPRKQILKGAANPLSSKLVLQTFLDFFKQNEGKSDEEVVKKFEEFINKACLRLVSTVHPNETGMIAILLVLMEHRT